LLKNGVNNFNVDRLFLALIIMEKNKWITAPILKNTGNLIKKRYFKHL
jgi:hypothetical protein